MTTGTSILLFIAAVALIVGTFLFLRANPGKRAKLDAVADAAEAKAKDAAAKTRLKIEELRK